MTRRVLIAESDQDVRELLELTVRRLGYETVAADHSGDVDVLLLEPACAEGRSALRRFGADAPPVVCLSIYPREDGFRPRTPRDLLECLSTEIADALRNVFGV
jgi:CheY-like chemotaxis protein